MNRSPAGFAALFLVLAVVIGSVAGLAMASIAGGSAAPDPGPRAASAAGNAPAGTASPSDGTLGIPSSSAPSGPTASPSPVLVPSPLDGLLVSPARAAGHPIAVMVDDLGPARPQSGFSEASIVWHAPAEGGIPRYMMVFGAGAPSSVGPVRSARYYFVAWAAEWQAVYVHAGGSPQALAVLRQKGSGQLVYNADEFRFGGTYLWRVKTRASPHNVYTDDVHLRRLATAVGATAPPGGPVWRFGPDAPLAARPIGGRIEIDYPANHVRYDYDRLSNTYLRSVSGEGAQVDAATGERVAPKNVVVMRIRFGPLNDGHPEKHRLEADVVGSGAAWIATSGRTIVGTWRKDALDGPTRFFDKAGNPVTLTAGQTFIQVVPLSWTVVVKDGKPAPPTRPVGAPAAS